MLTLTHRVATGKAFLSLLPRRVVDKEAIPTFTIIMVLLCKVYHIVYFFLCSLLSTEEGNKVLCSVEFLAVKHEGSLCSEIFVYKHSFSAI